MLNYHLSSLFVASFAECSLLIKMDVNYNVYTGSSLALDSSELFMIFELN